MERPSTAQCPSTAAAASSQPSPSPDKDNAVKSTVRSQEGCQKVRHIGIMVNVLLESSSVRVPALPLFCCVATLGKLFTHTASPVVSAPKNWGYKWDWTGIVPGLELLGEGVEPPPSSCLQMLIFE